MAVNLFPEAMSEGRISEELRARTLYGVAARRAVEHVVAGMGKVFPAVAWNMSVTRTATLGKTEPSARAAFLGLCEVGAVRGIPAGKYTSRLNKNGVYAVRAYNLLRSLPALADDEAALWRLASSPSETVLCGQLDVVLELWRLNLLRDLDERNS